MNSSCRMARQVPWKPIAILTTISTVLLSLLLLPACCCVKGPLAPITPAAAPVIPPIGPRHDADADRGGVEGADAGVDAQRLVSHRSGRVPRHPFDARRARFEHARRAAELRQQALVRDEGRHRHDRVEQRQPRRADEPLHLRLSQSAAAQSACGVRREAAQAERHHPQGRRHPFHDVRGCFGLERLDAHPSDEARHLRHQRHSAC